MSGSNPDCTDNKVWSFPYFPPPLVPLKKWWGGLEQDSLSPESERLSVKGYCASLSHLPLDSTKIGQEKRKKKKQEVAAFITCFDTRNPHSYEASQE